MKKLYLGIIGLFLIVIMASGCTSSNSQNYTTTKMSFTAPNDWKVVEYSNDSVQFIKDPDTINVMHLSKDDYKSIGTSDPVALDGYSYVGNFTDESSGIPYKMYNSTSSRNSGLQNIGYTFSKNGKYFAVWGTSDDDMMTIMRTIS